MRDSPKEILLGPFQIGPDSEQSGGRNVRIKYKIGNQELFIERADVPELVEGLMDAYGMDPLR